MWRKIRWWKMSWWNNGMSLMRACLMAAALSVMIVSCRTSRQQKSDAKEYAVELLSVPAVQDISGKMSVSYGSYGPFTVKVRMRWDDCVHLSYSVLGLMEVAAVDFLQDKVVLAFPLNQVYSELSYSDIPYVDMAKADFRIVQGLFWNRMSVYGISDPVMASQHVKLLMKDGRDGMRVLSDDISDFRFELDSEGDITTISKSVPLCKASARYFGFEELTAGFRLPAQMEVSVVYGVKAQRFKARYVGFSPASSGGDIRIDISSLSRIPADKLVDMIKDYLL